MTNEEKEKFYTALLAARKVIDDKFGFDVVMLDISAKTTLADYFIIAGVNNAAQMKAIADAVEETLHKGGVKLKHSEGGELSSWLLMDFGGLIVHLFTKEAREFYNLDELWGDAEVINA